MLKYSGFSINSDKVIIKPFGREKKDKVCEAPNARMGRTKMFQPDISRVKPLTYIIYLGKQRIKKWLKIANIYYTVR